MKRWIGAGGILVLLGIGGLVYTHLSTPVTSVPHAIDTMGFPAGFQVTGDKDGFLCHEIYQRFADGSPDRLLFHHVSRDRDWRRGTEHDKKGWIISDTKRDAEGVGIACLDPDGWFLDAAPAFADPPHCLDCGGGGTGCISWTCPATVNFGHCTLGGSNCAITFICCDTGCQASC